MRSPSLKSWFLMLFLLNMLDIATTMPMHESNPVTLYVWSSIGIFLAAWVKIGLVLLFGTLCVAANRVAKPDEWDFAKKVFRGILIILVAFYTFVVATNLTIITLSAVG